MTSISTTKNYDNIYLKDLHENYSYTETSVQVFDVLKL